jgi:hypothetical protein
MMKCHSYWRDTRQPWMHAEETRYGGYPRVLDVMHKYILGFYGKLDSFMMTCCSYWRDTHQTWMHVVKSLWISRDV